MSLGSHEVLAAGRDSAGPPSWLVWVLGAVSFALITVAGIFVVSDLAIRTVEADRLLTAVEASEAQMVLVQDRVRETLAPLEDGEPLTESERERVSAQLRQIAADGETAIAEAGVGVEQVQIVPWHPRLEAAREAYLAHNRAWVDYLAAASVEPAEFFVPQPEVNDTFAAAEAPLLAALPLLDPNGLRDRLAAIYAETGGGDGQDV